MHIDLSDVPADCLSAAPVAVRGLSALPREDG